MELVTASDLLVTASMALLLSFLVAKLVSLAMMITTPTDTHNTTKLHVHDEPVGPVLQGEQRLTVQSPQIENRLGFISPVQLTTTTTTNVEAEFIEDAAVESDSNVVVELPPPVKKSDIVFESTEEKTAVEEIKKDDSVHEAPTDRSLATEIKKGGSVHEVSTDCGLARADVHDFTPTSRETVSEFKAVNSGSRDSNLTIVPSEAKGRDDDDYDDWEWEGIERSEMEKVFMAATEFVAEKGFGGGDEVEMELYGLHKVAMEGPCRESQPMPLKLSARAKWNAWQKLGNMSPEVAMERYINILSDKVPRWMEDTSAGITESEPPRPEVSHSAVTDLSSSLSHQQTIAAERELEQEFGALDQSPLTTTDLENNVKK